MHITLLPLADIDASAIPRDRTALDEGALALLQRSILAEGLRQPIEVFPLEGAIPYALISGLRRLTVFRTLAPHLTRFATIPAFIRTPPDIPAALAAMVSENEARADVTPWEKAQLILTCVEDGHFPTPDAALLGLFPYLTPANRSRLRAVVTVAAARGSAKRIDWRQASRAVGYFPRTVRTTARVSQAWPFWGSRCSNWSRSLRAPSKS